MSDIGEQNRKIEPAQWSVVAIIVAFAAGAFLYKLLMHERLGHSAAMFLGIPAVLAILLALAPKAKTATGGILKGITLALLVVAPLLGEGYLCILVASPLFYIVGIVVGLAMDRLRRKRDATLSCVALFLLPMCFEGVVPLLTFNRAQSVEIRSVVAAPADEVEHALTRAPDVNAPLPLALRIGFPRPLAAWGEGLGIGDTRTIHFAGAEGDPPGDLLMRVTERRRGYARFETVSDQSKLTQWVGWDEGHTTVTWRIDFRRQLDPTWYFTPWERAAVKEAAAYLIDANATPVRRN
jgi:hypothetical protein